MKLYRETPRHERDSNPQL